jgi:acetylornithine deacetylase
VIDDLRIANIMMDGAIVTEPTGLQVAAAHRGYVWLEVETRGRAAHGSRWWEGIDANRQMGRVLGALDGLAGELVKRTPHPLVGPPSLHTPLIQGGSEMSIYAERCVLQIERRTVPGETPGGVEGEIQAVLDKLAADDAQFQGSVRVWFARPPFETRLDSALLPVIREKAAVVLEAPGEVGGVAFWTDAALLGEAGIDTVLIGPTGGGLHTGVEWVELESCAQLAEILAETARAYCSK